MSATPQFKLRSLGKFQEAPRESWTPAQLEVAIPFEQRRGTVPAPFRLFLSSAPFAKRMQALSDYVLRNGLFSSDEVEVAVLTAAAHLKFDFVAVAHRKIAAAAGVPQAAIDAILAGQVPAFANPRHEAVYRCARAMLTRTDAFDSVIAVIGQDGACEIAGILGFYCTCGFTLEFFEVPNPE